MGRVLLAGATVWAGPACVPARAWMLVEDGRVAALGDQEPLPPADRVVDLPGCHLLPGFVDVHLHLSQAAWIPRGGDGWGWRSLAEALRAVRAAGNASPQAPWLLFWNVARWSWPEGRLPTSGELDDAAPGRRVLVSSSDLHRGSVSSAGLEAIGPAEGDLARVFGEDIARDRRGRPTGELWEAAYGVALQRALADTAAHFQDAGTAAVYAAEAGRYLAHGITHAHDPYLAPDCHPQVDALRAAGPLRVSWATGAPDGILSRPPGPRNAPEGPYGDAGREVKVFADGRRPVRGHAASPGAVRLAGRGDE
jgi:predicted amidohydrolase YtcJ